MELDTLIYLNDLTLLHIWWWAILLITLQWKKNIIYNWIIVNVGSQRLDCFNKFEDIDTSATEWSLCCFRHLLFLLYGMFSYTFYFFFVHHWFHLIGYYYYRHCCCNCMSIGAHSYLGIRHFVAAPIAIHRLYPATSLFLISPVLGCFFSVVISAHFLQFRIP